MQQQKANAPGAQVGGDHYGGGAFQHWDFVIKHLENHYLEGQITKYLSRWRRKHGTQDLLKAKHYTYKLLEAFDERQIVRPAKKLPGAAVDLCHNLDLLCKISGLTTPDEQNAMLLCATWRGRTDIEAIIRMIDAVYNAAVAADGVASAERS